MQAPQPAPAWKQPEQAWRRRSGRRPRGLLWEHSAFRPSIVGGALCPNDDARRTQNDDADLAGALRRRSERKSNRRHCSASTPKKCLPTGSASTPPRSRACIRTASSEALAAGPPDLSTRAASAAHARVRPRPQRGLNSADPAALNSRASDQADISFPRPERVTQRSDRPLETRFPD